MTAMIFKLAGGIGLFLMGMVLLADGIKSFAGDALRGALVRFTGSHLKAFTSGALVTAMVQSSSATTVAVIGFVSAGLLTFPQSVGVVLGASLGTTGTGWIVSVLGLKVSIGFYALPLVGVGAFMMLLARSRWRSLGLALAGFGLIFVGIETLQDGMRGLAGAFNLAALPSSGIFRHFLMIAIGAAMTVVMQSSSAAVATMMTALHADAVTFEQSAYLVIGAAIGTTVTGAMASIGASVSTKRTALAHVLFNLATGLIAVVLLPLFLWGSAWAHRHMGLAPGAASLAAFHTLFIAIGAALFLPFLDGFSKWIERLLPERGPLLTRHLDTAVLTVPAVALEATRRALSETACELFRAVQDGLGGRGGQEPGLAETSHALHQTQQFLSKIPPVTEGQPLSQLRVSQVHAVEHLFRLRSSLPAPAILLKKAAGRHFQEMVNLSREILTTGEAGLSGRASDDWIDSLEKKSLELSELHRKGRPAVIRQTAESGVEPVAAMDVLDAMRWLDRVGYHVWRISYYLVGEGQQAEAIAEIEASPEE